MRIVAEAGAEAAPNIAAQSSTRLAKRMTPRPLKDRHRRLSFDQKSRPIGGGLERFG